MTGWYIKYQTWNRGWWLGWGGVRGAPAGWLTVGAGGALAGPRRVGLTAGMGHATPAYAPRTPLREADPRCQLGGRVGSAGGGPLRRLTPAASLTGHGSSINAAEPLVRLG